METIDKQLTHMYFHLDCSNQTEQSLIDHHVW